MSLPGQTFTNGVSNFLFGTNMTQDYATHTVRNTSALQQKILAGGFTLMRCSIPANSADSYIDQTAKACQACGCAMLVILIHDNPTWNQHLVTYLGNRCNLYEFANEPDLYGGGYTASDYLTGWNANIPTLRSINPTAAFIGPVIGVFANLQSWLNVWLPGTVTAGTVPDAISYHVYPCTGTTDSTVCAPKANNFSKDAASVRTWTSNNLGYTLPLALTEWNIDANAPPQPYTQDANFCRTWTETAIAAMVAGNIDIACQFDAASGAAGGEIDMLDTVTYQPHVQYQPMVDEIKSYLAGSGSALNPYGITIASVGSQILDQVLQDAVSLGLGWIRLQVHWENIETTKGVYNTAMLDVIDSCVSRCNKMGLSVQFAIQYPPVWRLLKTGCGDCVTNISQPHNSAMCWNGLTDPAYNDGKWHQHDPTQTAAFADFMSSRYNGVTNVSGYGPLYIDAWEIGNEEFDQLFDGTQPLTSAGQTCRQATWMIPCLQKCYPVIKNNTANAPQGPALVGMGALWWTDTQHRHDFMQALYANGCKNFFDYANFHSYVAATPPDQNASSTVLSLGGQIDTMYQVMAANGDGNKDIWVTEFGWTAPKKLPGDTTSGDINDDPSEGAGPYRQSFFAWPVAGVKGDVSAGAFEIARTSGHVGVMNIYTMNRTDPAKNPKSPLYSLTLYNTDPSTGTHYTPSYAAVQKYIQKYPNWESGTIAQARDLSGRVKLKVASPVQRTRDVKGRVNLRTAGASTQRARDLSGRVSIKQLAQATTPRVMLVLMENRSYGQVIGNTNWPNLNVLASTYAFASNCYGVLHPSLPNYLSLISGSTQGVTNDNPPGQNGPFNGTTFVDELQTASIPWQAYFEGYPSVGYTGGNTGTYVVRHNPFVYFNSILTSSAKLNKLVPSSQLDADLASSTPPAFIWYTPDVNDDGHDTTGHIPDNWLGSFISKVQASNWYAGGGRIIIAWDESLNTDTAGIGDANPGGGHIACVVVCESSRNIADLTTPVNHYGLLHALCSLYGVAQLSNSAHSSNGDLTPLFGSNSATALMDVRGRVNLQDPGRSRNVRGRVNLTIPVSATLTLLDISGRVKLGVVSITPRSRDLAGRVNMRSQVRADVHARVKLQGLQFQRSRDLAGRVQLVYAQDTFNRADNTAAWGTNAESLVWTRASGAATPSLVSKQAKISGNQGQGAVMLLGSASVSDGEGLVRVSTTNTGNAPSIVLRSDGAGSNFYRATLRNGILTLTKVVNGANTDLVTLSATIATTTSYWLRFRAQGSKLSARYWQDGTAEPSTWHLTKNDSTFTAGNFGLRSFTGATGESVVFDHYSLFSPIYPTTALLDVSGRINLCDDQDTFNRTPIADGWGTAIDGSIWLEDGGPSVTSTSETSGLIASSTGTTYEVLGQGTAADQDVTVQFSAGTTADTAGILLRYQSANSWYAAAFSKNALILLRCVAGTQNTLVSQSFVLSPGTLYNVHARLKNSSLSANLWLAGTAEPSGWMLTASDSSIGGTGQWGLLGNATTSAPCTYDNFVAVALSKLGSGDITARVVLRAINALDVVGRIKLGSQPQSRDVRARIKLSIPTATKDVKGRVKLRAPTATKDVSGRVKLAYDQDTFIRANTTATNPPAWGTATSGETWTWTGSSVGNISSNQGLTGLTTGQPVAALGSQQLADAEVLVRVSLGATTLDGASAAVRIGTSAANNHYRGGFADASTLKITKVVGGVTTDLATSTITTVSAGALYWIRFRVIGSTLSLKYWQDGTSEPGAWNLFATDTALATGQFGIRSKATLTTSNTFDSFVVLQAQPTASIQDLSGRVKLAGQQTKDVQGRVKLGSPTQNKDVTGRVILQARLSRDMSARVKVVISPARDITGRVKMTAPIAPEYVKLSTTARTGSVSTTARTGILSTTARGT